MIEMTLAANGQFTFDPSLMEYLGIKVGDKIGIEKQPDGSLRINAIKKQNDIMDFASVFKSDITLTDAELKSAIEESYAGREMRGLG